MVKAKVVLRGAKTYTLRGKRWIKDVPQIVTDEGMLSELKSNGYFHVAILSQSSKTAKKVEEKVEDSPEDKLKKKVTLRK